MHAYMHIPAICRATSVLGRTAAAVSSRVPLPVSRAMGRGDGGPSRVSNLDGSAPESTGV